MKYIPRYYFSPPTERKFISLMTSDDSNIMQRLAAFTFHAMKVRKEINDNQLF